jgi:hypothetical protein
VSSAIVKRKAVVRPPSNGGAVGGERTGSFRVSGDKKLKWTFDRHASNGTVRPGLGNRGYAAPDVKFAARTPKCRECDFVSRVYANILDAALDSCHVENLLLARDRQEDGLRWPSKTN